MHLETLLSRPATVAPEHKQLFEKAKEIESVFLSEMLSHAGLGESSDSFGGGLGEDQFASFLRDEQARGIAEQGGLGMAQTIFSALVKGEEARHDRAC